MDLNVLREERKKWLTWKNIIPYQKAIKELPQYESVEVTLGDRVHVDIANLSDDGATQVKETALLMKPWRKDYLSNQ